LLKNTVITNHYNNAAQVVRKPWGLLCTSSHRYYL